MPRARSLGVSLYHRLSHPVNPASVIFFAGFTMLWGLWVLNPWWEAFNQSAIYMTLNYFGPEWIWGLLATICGSVMVYETIRNNSFNACRGAFLGFIHWIIIGIAFLLGDWQNASWVLCAMISTICAYIYLNVKVNQVN